MAVDDGVVLKAPFGFEFAGVVVNDSVTRGAITKDQMPNLTLPVLEDATDELRRMEELENVKKELEKNRKKKPVSQKMFREMEFM